MKKFILLLVSILFVFNYSFSQTHNNVRLCPERDTVCYGTPTYFCIAGNSFVPTSYLWSDGQTTPSININSSGTYSVTITGYVGQSRHSVTINKSKYFTVLTQPKITPITATWVCKYDTVKLQADAGYTSYSWNNGQFTQVYERQMTGSGGGPILDTVSVWYTAKIDNVCQVNSDTIVIRGIRLPDGVGIYYQGRTNLTINDSVPAGLVLTYIYAPQYEMEFTKTIDPNYIVTWITPTTTRKAPLSILEPGYSYFVRTRPIINGVTYCWGESSLIGILPAGNRIFDNSFNNGELTIYGFYDLSGRYLFNKVGYEFDNNWLNEFPNQILIVVQKNNSNVSSSLRSIVR